MDEYDLIHVLSKASSRQEEGKAYLEKLKTASPAGEFVAHQLNQHKQKLIDTALGGGVIAGISYARSRKNKLTGHSKDQVHWNKALKNTEKQYKEKSDSGQKLDYSDRMKILTTRGHKGQADISADHPIKSSLKAGALYGLPAGLAGRLIYKILTRKG